MKHNNLTQEIVDIHAPSNIQQWDWKLSPDSYKFQVVPKNATTMQQIVNKTSLKSSVGTLLLVAVFFYTVVYILTGVNALAEDGTADSQLLWENPIVLVSSFATIFYLRSLLHKALYARYGYLTVSLPVSSEYLTLEGSKRKAYHNFVKDLNSKKSNLLQSSTSTDKEVTIQKYMKLVISS